MWCVGYLLCLFILCHQVDENSAQVSHPYIVSIKLELQEERIPRLIAESLFGNNTILAQYFDYSHVSLDDVTEVIGTSVTLGAAFKALGIELSNIGNMMSQTTFSEIVKAGNINMHYLYSTFVQHFVVNPMKDIPILLNSLNIDSQKFSTTVVFGTDKELLDILLGGSYTKRNIENALQVIKHDVTMKEALSFIKAARLGEALTSIKNTSSDIHVFETLRRLLVVNKVLSFINLLNITSTNFYRNEAFSKILKNIVDTKEELVGTAVSATSIVTNSNSKTLIDHQFLKNYTKLTATLIENADMKYVVFNTSVVASSSVATLPVLHTLQLRNYLNISSSIDSRRLNSCTYVSLDVLCNSLYIENVTVRLNEDGFLIINKTNSTIFSVGSPLICGEYLYGVADWEHDSFISFIPLHLEIESYMRKDEGYLAVVMEYVKQARTVVLSGICNVLQFLNIGVCSNMFNF